MIHIRFFSLSLSVSLLLEYGTVMFESIFIQSSLRYLQDSYSGQWENIAKHENSGGKIYFTKNIYLILINCFFLHFSVRGILAISCVHKTDLNRRLTLASSFSGNFPVTREFSAFLPYLYSPSLSVSRRIKTIRSGEHVWWAADRRQRPPFYAVPADVP